MFSSKCRNAVFLIIFSRRFTHVSLGSSHAQHAQLYSSYIARICHSLRLMTCSVRHCFVAVVRGSIIAPPGLLLLYFVMELHPPTIVPRQKLHQQAVNTTMENLIVPYPDGYLFMVLALDKPERESPILNKPFFPAQKPHQCHVGTAKVENKKWT